MLSFPSLSMDSVAFFLLITSLLFTASAQQRETNITRGSHLIPITNSSWLSPSGLYAFGFYQQGNGYSVGVFLAGIPEKTIVWTVNRDDPPVSSNATLLFTDDGRLVLRSPQGEESSLLSASQAAQPASLASMSDSGNFVLYNSDRNIIWQSFDYPTDTILPTQPLRPGKELVSSVSETEHSTGIFRLKMQGDGNLVQYPVGTPDTASYAYWASGTAGSGDNVTLNLDPDGRLYLLNLTGFNVIKNMTDGGYTTKETIYMMKIDVDGIFRLYSHNMTQNGNWSTRWSSTANKCAPKGLCGLNGYCVMNDRVAQCTCLPGFAFVNQGNQTAGCERDFVADSCKDKNRSSTFTIEELPNTVWEDVSYSVLSLSIKDDCKQACLEDCNCEAALFSDGKCRKQRLPLRFGGRNLESSNLALIKVGKSRTTIDNSEPTIEKKNLRKEILIISASFVSFGLVMLAIFGMLIYRYHALAYKRVPNIENISCEEFAPRAFTYAELEKVTSGFKEELGRGSFGTVYKGLISSTQKTVAVKRLEKVLAEGEREFQNEMKAIGKTHHRNLVRLLGYCHEGTNRLLVYEYMCNGSLADILFSSPEKRPCFIERLEISRNIARGIVYLHEECETQIIHCDVKPQNILMDGCRCPKVSDFGLAKLLKADQTKTFTGIRGTRGYVAPEWHRNMPVTVKADVYSFGIMLLEITCCRKNVDWSLPEEEAILEEWVYKCFADGDTNKLIGDEIVDKRQLDRMVKVGLWCTLDEPSLRPAMKKVLLMLEGTVEIPIPPSPTSFFSAI